MKYLIWVLCLLSAGCTSVYGPAMLSNDVAHIRKPIYVADSSRVVLDVTAIYSSGGVYNINDKSSQGQLMISAAQTWESVTAGIGAYGFMGNYYRDFSDQSNDFYGYGVRGDFHLNFPMPHVEFRPIGLELSYSQEYGSFAKFRKQMAFREDVSASTSVVTLLYSAEVVLKRANLHMRIFIGGSFITDRPASFENNRPTTIGGSVLYHSGVWHIALQMSAQDNTSLISGKLGVGLNLRR